MNQVRKWKHKNKNLSHNFFSFNFAFPLINLTICFYSDLDTRY